MGVNRTLIGLTLRQAIRQRRLLVMVLLAVPLLTAILLRVYQDPAEDPILVVATELAEIILTGIVPMLALLVAHGGLGHEVEDGTIVTLLTTPVSRVRIVLLKMLTLGGAVAGMTALMTLIATTLPLGRPDPTRLVLGLTVAAAIGGFLYTQLFLALTLLTRRGLLIGLLYILIWEGVLTRFFQGMNSFSLRQFLWSTAAAVTTVEEGVFTALVPLSTAWPMMLLAAGGTMALCLSRLRAFELGRAG